MNFEFIKNILKLSDALKSKGLDKQASEIESNLFLLNKIQQILNKNEKV